MTGRLTSSECALDRGQVRSGRAYLPFDYLVSGQARGPPGGNRRLSPTLGSRATELEIGPTGGRSRLLAGVRLLARDCGS